MANDERPPRANVVDVGAANGVPHLPLALPLPDSGLKSRRATCETRTQPRTDKLRWNQLLATTASTFSVGRTLFHPDRQGSAGVGRRWPRLLDYVGSWGAAHRWPCSPCVVRAVQQTAERGLSFGAPTEQRGRNGGTPVRLSALAPQQVRLAESGTEQRLSAIRLARGVHRSQQIIRLRRLLPRPRRCAAGKAGSGALTFVSLPRRACRSRPPPTHGARLSTMSFGAWSAPFKIEGRRYRGGDRRGRSPAT